MSSDLLIRYGGPFAPGLVKSASGSFIEMEDGSRVLDFTAGQICATIGHNHPRVVEAIERSCREVMHLNSWSLSPPVISLAERLIDTLPAPLERAMFLSTGGEANEAALRMAKLASGKFEVVALTRSWHGVTAGASAHTHAGGRRGHGPATPGAFAIPAPVRVPLPDPPLRRQLRLQLPRGRLRAVRPGQRGLARPRCSPSRCCRPAA